MKKLALIMTYCMLINVFFVLMEVFTTFYSRIPSEMEHFNYLFFGLDGNYQLVPLMWLSVLLSLAALALLVVPRWREDMRLLTWACVLVFVSLWLDKGFALLVGGFVPSPLGEVARYTPTLNEWTVTVGIWAIGALMITLLYKIMFLFGRNHSSARVGAGLYVRRFFCASYNSVVAGSEPGMDCA